MFQLHASESRIEQLEIMKAKIQVIFNNAEVGFLSKEYFATNFGQTRLWNIFIDRISRGDVYGIMLMAGRTRECGAYIKAVELCYEETVRAGPKLHFLCMRQMVATLAILEENKFQNENILIDDDVVRIYVENATKQYKITQKEIIKRLSLLYHLMDEDDEIHWLGQVTGGKVAHLFPRHKARLQKFAEASRQFDEEKNK